MSTRWYVDYTRPSTYDAVAVVEADELGGLEALIASSIQPVRGVEQTLTCLAVEV